MRATGANPANRTRGLVMLSQVYADGGIQRFNRMFLSACDQLGIACDVLSLGDSEESRSRWAAPASATMRLFGRSKVRFAAAVGAAVLQGRYDFIVVGHINLLQLVAGSVMLLGTHRPRVLLIAHGIEVWTGMATWRCKRAMSGVDLILCVSRYTRERIRAQRPELADERYAIFPNALSESWLQQFAQVRPADIAQELPARFILAVTRLDRGDRYKGLTTLIESLAMMEDRSVHCVVAGQGNDQPFLERMAQRFNVIDRVHFAGAVSDAQLARLYEECAAFVLPSGKEGFGIVFLEAMFFGAPIVAAREKGAVDVVQHEHTGLLVPYGDTISLTAAISRILRDQALRTKLKENGRQLVGSDGTFSFRAYVTRLGKLLKVASDGEMLRDLGTRSS